MAQQHSSVGNEAAERLLRKKLDLLKGGERSRTSSALDLLTGNAPSSVAEPEPIPAAPAPAIVTVEAPVEAAPEPLPERAPRTRRSVRRGEMRRRTVYLSEQDLERIGRIQQAEHIPDGESNSRSAVVRQAIARLFATLQTEADQTEESA